MWAIAKSRGLGGAGETTETNITVAQLRVTTDALNPAGSRQVTAHPSRSQLKIPLSSTPSAIMTPHSPSGSLLSSAYLVPSQSAYETEDEVASLPSESTTDSDLETMTDDGSDAEAEWQESLEQLELLLTMVLVPFIGKFLGRKCAYWSR